jgi:predicted phosphoribosyltransferase
MSEFANLADGGRRLGPMLAGAMSGVVDPVILAVIPNGVPVAAGIRESFDGRMTA